MKATQLYRKHNGENSVTSPGKVNGRVSAAERTQLHRAFCLAAEQSRHKPRRLWGLGCSAARWPVGSRYPSLQTTWHFLSRETIPESRQ